MKLIYLALAFLLIYLSAAKAAVVWDGGGVVQTYNQGFRFGNAKTIDVSSGDYIFDSSGQFNGPLRLQESAEPSSPSFGLLSLFIDSTTKELKKKDENGNSLPVDFNEIDEVNLLKNRSFELADVDSSWDYFKSGASLPSVETSIVLEGKQSVVLNPSSETFDFTQTISIDQYDGKVVGFSCEINSTENVDVCFMEGTTELSCTTKNIADKWSKVEVLGSVISGNTYGIRIKSDVAITDNIYIDKCEFTSNPLNFKDGVITEYYEVERNANFWDATGSVDDWDFTLGSNFNNRLFEIRDEGGQTRIYAKQDISIDIQFHGSTATSSGMLLYNSSDNLLALQENSSNTLNTSVSASIKLSANDYIYARGQLAIRIGGITLLAVAKNPQIIENADIVSSENITYVFKGSGSGDIVDSDPIGTYTTWDYPTTGTNAVSQCASAPSVLPNNQDGIRISMEVGGRGVFGCTNPAKYKIKVGKGLKGLKLFGYIGANKTRSVSTELAFSANGAATYGAWKDYDEKTGVLQIDTGYLHIGSETQWAFVGLNDPLGDVIVNTNWYAHFALSKNPIVNAIDAVPRVDYSWENEFSARINNNGTATLVSEGSPFIQSVTRSAVGRVDIVFTAGFFTQAPSVVAEADAGGAGSSNISTTISGLSTSGVTIVAELTTSAGTNSDANFNIKVSRQGSDYRSRGDAAAIIGLPTMIVEVSANGRDSIVDSTSYKTRNIVALSGETLGASLGINSINMPKGTYIFEMPTGTRGDCDGMDVQLFNVDDSTEISVQRTATSTGSQTDTVTSIQRFTLSSPKEVEVRTRIVNSACSAEITYNGKIVRVK